MNDQRDPESQDGPENSTIKRTATEIGNKELRLLRVDQIYSRKDRQIHYVKTAKSVKSNRFRKTALVVRRQISQKGMVVKISVDIKSDYLKDIFLEIFKDVEELELTREPPVADPELFFFAEPALIERQLVEKAKTNPDEALINDIRTALRFVKEDFGEKTASLDSLLAQGDITFDLLWAIFRPKEVLLAPSHGLLNQPQGLLQLGSQYAQRANGQRYLDIRCLIISHDGDRFGHGELYFEINEFLGSRKIIALEVYPLRYDSNPQNRRDGLVSRGRRYLSLIAKARCLDYNYSHGIKEVENPNSKDFHEWTRLCRFNASGRVMLDAEAFRMYDGSAFKLNSPDIYDRRAITKDMASLTDDEALLCAYWINGFSLTQKTWGQFAIVHCTDITWNEHAFDKLVIPERRRHMIHMLVRSHRQDEGTFDDIVDNKGKGLVGLLTGSPGVGKTLTAEAVAEVTGRPLYMVSGGELGVDAEELDNRVEQILDITRRWNCVLLIDEADVFMAARGNDLTRDMLVSIFLRRLEYFRGVLILTTNRDETIDRAFHSRIHFTLRYEDLTQQARAVVWRNFLSAASTSSPQAGGKNESLFALSDGDITTRLASRELNGRQIKNAVSIAASVAREESRGLGAQDIEELIDLLVT